MKTLVIYDSNFGNTKIIAEELARNIVGVSKAVSVGQFKDSDLDNLDLLIVGSPINGWRPTESILKMLNSIKGKIQKGLMFTTFDTRIKVFYHGDAKDKLANMLKASGAKLMSESQAFYVIGKDGPLVDGELERAANWAKSIKSSK